MSDTKKNETYLIIIVAFMLLVVGMGIGGRIGILTIGAAIVLFLIAIVISLTPSAKRKERDGDGQPGA